MPQEKDQCHITKQMMPTAHGMLLLQGLVIEVLHRNLVVLDMHRRKAVVLLTCFATVPDASGMQSLPSAVNCE